MNDHDLDQSARCALKRTEPEPDLWPRLRPATKPRPSLLSEALTCTFSGACALALLWFAVPVPPEVMSPPPVAAELPLLTSADEKAIANWIATGRHEPPDAG
ncbi:MAG: hypothetical protein ACO1SV_13025 [Fimbriimonas sp.]